MTEADLERIRSAWRIASPADIVDALGAVAEYDPRVIAIIRAEADRRGLAADSDEALPPPTYAALRKVAAPVTDRLRRAAERFGPRASIRKLIMQSLSLAGLYLGASLVLGFLNAWPLAWILYVVGLFVISRPLREYRTALLAPLFTGGTIVVVVLLLVWSSYRSPSILGPSFWSTAAYAIAIASAIHVVVPAVLLITTAFARNRFWPLPRPGHCRVCGYNLYGLPEPRCPECGTPFESVRRVHPDAPSRP
jgi:hypothetical protein